MPHRRRGRVTIYQRGRHRLGDRGADIAAICTHLEPDFMKAAYQRVFGGPLANVLKEFSRRVDQLSGALSRVSTLFGVSRQDSGRGGSRWSAQPEP